MSKPISQREARRLRKRVYELESKEVDRNSRWSSAYPGGVNIDHITVHSAEWHIMRTARLLGHAVVAVPSEIEGKVMIYGVKP